MTIRRVSLKGLDSYITDVLARNPGFVAEIERIAEASRIAGAPLASLTPEAEAAALAAVDAQRLADAQALDASYAMAEAFDARMAGKPGSIERDMAELVGDRCKSFEPGCPCCDAWEAFDLGAFWALRADLDETRAWAEEWYSD